MRSRIAHLFRIRVRLGLAGRWEEARRTTLIAAATVRYAPDAAGDMTALTLRSLPASSVSKLSAGCVWHVQIGIIDAGRHH